MPRPKTNKTVQSISFDNDVYSALREKCRKETSAMSTFVNHIVRQVVMSEYEFYRQKAKQHASKLSEYQHLMDTAIDKPGVMK